MVDIKNIFGIQEKWRLLKTMNWYIQDLVQDCVAVVQHVENVDKDKPCGSDANDVTRYLDYTRLETMNYNREEIFV